MNKELERQFMVIWIPDPDLPPKDIKQFPSLDDVNEYVKDKEGEFVLTEIVPTPS